MSRDVGRDCPGGVRDRCAFDPARQEHNLGRRIPWEARLGTSIALTDDTLSVCNNTQSYHFEDDKTCCGG
jgi:hypothetical protein